MSPSPTVAVASTDFPGNVQGEATSAVRGGDHSVTSDIVPALIIPLSTATKPSPLEVAFARFPIS